MPKPFLQPHHKQYIKDNYLTLSGCDMAKHLGCSSSVVNKYKRDNNLKMPEATSYALRAEKNTGRTTFTPEQDVFIKENYLTMPMRAIGRHLDKSFTGVRIRLRQMGLHIPAEVRKARKEGNRFKSGHVPANKGIPIAEWMSPEQMEKHKQSRFKKGHVPHNTAYNGYERETNDGYTEVRVALGVFKFKHRLIWEHHNGKIPKACVVAFKDGNKQNYAVANLELISRAKHMQNNSIANYPPELRQSIRLISKLKKQTDAN